MPQIDDLVSVIIACYNAQDWLDEAITSALSQTWGNLEIIVVDDGSVDASLEICNKFSCNERVVVISQERRGAAAARNRGIEAARGEWFQFLDADDLLAPDKIARQLQRAKAEGKNFLYSSSWVRFYDDSRVHEPDQNPLCCGDLEPIEWLVRKYSGNNMMALHAWLVPRHLLEREQGWDEGLSLNDDGEYFDRLVLASAGVKHVCDAMCYYRTGHGTSMSRAMTRVAAESAMRSIEFGTRRLLSLEDSKKTRNACATQFQYIAYQFAICAPDLSNRAEMSALLLGGTEIELPGGPWLSVLTRLIGWRKARWLQNWYYRLRY